MPEHATNAERIRATFPNASRAFLRANGITVSAEVHASIYGLVPANPSPVAAPAGVGAPPAPPKARKSQPLAGKGCPTESAEQAAFVARFRLSYATLGLPSPLLLMASQAGAPLGGGSGGVRFARFAKLKREGFVAGVPDLFLAVARGGDNGLFIEMKRAKGGTVSPEQMHLHGLLRYQGYRVLVCLGADEAWKAVVMYCRKGVQP